MDGFGLVPRDQEDHLPWHESVMRMLFALALLGLARTSGEVRHFAEMLSTEEYRSRGYYERWLVAVEALIGRARDANMTALMEAATTPSGAALGLGDQQQQPSAGDQRDTNRFAVGTSVIVKDDPGPGHNRLPVYVRGHTGVVRAVYPPQEVPSTQYDGSRSEAVYNVAFIASDLWEDGRAEDEIRIDLFESYLHG